MTNEEFRSLAKKDPELFSWIPGEVKKIIGTLTDIGMDLPLIRETILAHPNILHNYKEEFVKKYIRDEKFNLYQEQLLFDNLIEGFSYLDIDEKQEEIIEEIHKLLRFITETEGELVREYNEPEDFSISELELLFRDLADGGCFLEDYKKQDEIIDELHRLLYCVKKSNDFFLDDNLFLEPIEDYEDDDEYLDALYSYIISMKKEVEKYIKKRMED